ncbi:MAG: hypothetical protein H6707_01495 [Deltaproteobacteria bacterium]|nr:hypothetical protein [Deltaproteobacteria bacterium]
MLRSTSGKTWTERTVGGMVVLLILAFAVGCRGQRQDASLGQLPLRQELAVFSKSTSPRSALAKVPRGPFGLSLVSSLSGKPLSIENFAASSSCAECHERQYKEFKGSMHSVAHTDRLYRRTAELALREAGPEVYALCAGCHAPQGVSSGLIPKLSDDKLPAIAKAGIICDVCHQIGKLTGTHGPFAEPGNASFVFDPDEERKFGPPTGDDAAADHPVKTRAFLQSSEFCASCHTVIHPTNGLRIEHTYDEWKRSVYAERKIQCQDCHMRSVAQAIEVARTLKPQPLIGKSTAEGKPRPIAMHSFVGGNANADLLGGGADHAKIAEARLKSAARLKLSAARIGATRMRIEVAVTNVGAGHHLPTSLTELREIWVELKVFDARRQLLFHAGKLDAGGEIDRLAMRFGARAADQHGKVTFKPWEITHFVFKRLIPAKQTARDAFLVALPNGAHGPLSIEATLLYRSAPPALVKALIGKDAPELRVTTMATARTTLAL